MATSSGFVHPEYLVDAAWVDAHKGDSNVVVVDTDVEAAYNRGHIAGAVMVPDNFEKNPDTGRTHIMNPQQFTAMCQNLGIGDDSLVIAYDNSQSLYAARLWWALNYYGHGDVKVLDGGWRRWISEARQISFDRPNPDTSVRFTPRSDESHQPVGGPVPGDRDTMERTTLEVGAGPRACRREGVPGCCRRARPAPACRSPRPRPRSTRRPACRPGSPRSSPRRLPKTSADPRPPGPGRRSAPAVPDRTAQPTRPSTGMFSRPL